MAILRAARARVRRPSIRPSAPRPAADGPGARSDPPQAFPPQERRVRGGPSDARPISDRSPTDRIHGFPIAPFRLATPL